MEQKEKKQQEKEKKINIFSDPEKIDAVIKSRLSMFSRKGGTQKNDQVKWTEEELELRDAVIIDYITVNGLSRERTAQQIADRWDVSMNTARTYVKNAVQRFCDNVVEESEEMRKKLFEEKLQSIYEDAVNAKDRQSSLKAIDILNKMNGMYKDKSDVNLTVDGSITFDFGNN